MKSILVLCLIVPAFLQSQDIDSLSTNQLGEVVVMENRIKIPVSESNRSIDIISRQDIKNAPFQSLADILQTVAGLDTRQRGVGGVQSDLSIRGSSFDENLLLINGVKLTDPQTGHHLMNLPFSYQDIERVEIIKGAAARIFGQNAYAGAVNIITKSPDIKSAWFESSAGIGITDSAESDSTFMSYKIGAGISLPGKKYSQYISASRIASNGYQYNSDYQTNNVFYNSVLTLEHTLLKLQGGYSMREFGANGFYAGNEETEKINTGLASIELERKIDNLNISARAYTRVNKDDYKFNRFNPQWFHNVHRTNSTGVEVNLSYLSSLGITGFGWEFREERIEGLEEEQLATNALLNDDFRNNTGFYFEHFYSNEYFSITPGVYVNYHSIYGLSSYPGVDIGVNLSNKTRILGSYGRSYRVPTFFDLYYSSASAATFGDPDLVPGNANTYEIGLENNQKAFDTKLNLFYIDAENAIDWVHDENNPAVNWQAMNFDNITKYGAEFSGSFKFSPSSKIKSLNGFYNYLFSDLQDSNFRSRYALSHLRHKVGVNTTVNIAGNLFMSTNVAVYSRPSFTDQNLLMGTQPVDTYMLLDGRLFLRKNNFDIYIEGNNMLNAQYIEVGGTNRPGFWLNFGFKYSMERL